MKLSESSGKILTIGQEFAKKIAFPKKMGFQKSFDFSRLEISSPGTLFAFIQFQLTHSDREMEETSEELANRNGVKFMCKRFILGSVIWLILIAVVAFLQNA